MLIQFGIIVTNASGAMGGGIISSNGSGAYAKSKVKTRNKQSIAQLTQRAIVAIHSQAWRNLTEAQRLNWKTSASSFKIQNRLGIARSPSGFNLFTRSNINLAIIGETAITDPPIDSYKPPPTQMSAKQIKIAAQKVVTFKAGNDLAHKVKIVATPSFSFGAGFKSRDLRIIEIMPGTDETDYDVTASYNAVFGDNTQDDAVVYFGISTIDIATGLESSFLWCKMTWE